MINHISTVYGVYRNKIWDIWSVFLYLQVCVRAWEFNNIKRGGNFLNFKCCAFHHICISWICDKYKKRKSLSTDYFISSRGRVNIFLIIRKPEIETTGYKKTSSDVNTSYAIKLQRFLCRIKVNVYFLNPYAKSYTIRVKRINFVTANSAGYNTRLVLAKSKTAASSNCMNTGV